MAIEQISPMKSSRRRLLLVDDHSLVTETIAFAFHDILEWTVESCPSVANALLLIEETGRYDVILLDYDLPGTSDLDGLEQLMEANSDGVALFSGYAKHSTIKRALSIGARGFLPKTMSLSALRHALNFIADGEIFIPATFAIDPNTETAVDLGLKPRERDVLSLLADGLPNKEIGRLRNLPESIVKLDVKSICRKLGVDNRTQAAIKARNMRIV